jgi:hypothetical protein
VSDETTLVRADLAPVYRKRRLTAEYRQVLHRQLAEADEAERARLIRTELSQDWTNQSRKHLQGIFAQYEGGDMHAVKVVREAYEQAGMRLLPSEERVIAERAAMAGLTPDQRKQAEEIVDHLEAREKLREAQDAWAMGHLMEKVIERKLLDLPLARRQFAAQHLLSLGEAMLELEQALAAL